MSVRLACPQCKHAFAPPSTTPGSEFSCPSCGKTVKIAAKKQPAAAAGKSTADSQPLPTAKPLAKSKPAASDSVQSLPLGKVAPSQPVAQKRAPNKPAPSKPAPAKPTPPKAAPLKVAEAEPNLPQAKAAAESIPQAKPLAGKKAPPPIAKSPAPAQDSSADLPVAPLVSSTPEAPSNSMPVGAPIPQEPVAQDPVPQPSAASGGFDFGGDASSSGGSSPVRRRPQKGLPIPLIAGIGGGALLLIIALLFAFSGSGGPATATGDGDGEENNGENTPTAGQEGEPNSTPGNTPAVTPAVAQVPTVELDSVQRQEIWDRIQYSVVRIEADGPKGKKTGLGFIADGAGWIVTNNHLVDRATKVTVTTTLDEKIEAIGVIEVDEAANAVIIAVPPEKLATGRVMRFAKDWKGSKGDLIALSPTNNPSSESIVGYNFRETLTSTKLPPSSKALLREFEMDADDDEMRWLAFDAQISDPSATGGPLVNEQGHLIGLYTALSPSSTSGYAVPVSVISELVSGATNDVVPFGDNEIASNTNTDPSDPDIDNPNPTDTEPSNEPDPNGEDPDEPDSGNPDPNNNGFPSNPVNPPQTAVAPEWSADDIKTVFNEGKEFQWNPTAVAEYASLQRFAGKAYRAFHADTTGEGTDEERREAQKVAKDSINQLMAVIWKTEERVKNVNKFAAEEMEKSNIGVLAYCEVLGQAQMGGKALVLMKLTGEEKYIAVPVGQGAAQMTSSSRWVVLGVPTGQQVNFQGTANVTANIVEAYHVIGRNEL